jgi:hypothetical protein
MDFFALWLPILASAAAVWIAAALAWMALPHHRKDHKSLPDEKAFTDAIRSMGIQPGSYVFPQWPSGEQKKDPEFTKRWEEGPTGMLSVWPKANMGRNMALTFLVYLAVSFFIGYIAAAALQPGAGFSPVFQLTGAAGILGYCFAFLPGAIWFNHSPRATLTCFLDGIAFGLITGLVFALLWPAAS